MKAELFNGQEHYLYVDGKDHEGNEKTWTIELKLDGYYLYRYSAEYSEEVELICDDVVWEEENEKGYFLVGDKKIDVFDNVKLDMKTICNIINGEEDVDNYFKS